MTDNDSKDSDPLLLLVDLLSGLLKLLYPFPEKGANSNADAEHKKDLDSGMLNPNIITLADFKRRYQFTGLGPLAMTAIEQSQRIVQASGKFEEIGLSEFHFGLILLQCKDMRGAIQHFQAARKQWLYVDKTAAVRLSYLAEGLTQQQVYAYEAALICLREVEQMKQRIHLEPPPKNREKFLREVSGASEAAQKAIREILEKQTTPAKKTDAQKNDTAQPDTKPSPDSGDVSLPINNQQTSYQFDSPILDHKTKNNHLTWYRVHTRRDDPLFDDVKDSGWFLVQQPETKQEVKENALVVVASNDPDTKGSVILKPLNGGEQVFLRIYLARNELEGTFSRTENQVTLSSEIRHVLVDIEHILGYVVGLWLEI